MRYLRGLLCAAVLAAGALPVVASATVTIDITGTFTNQLNSNAQTAYFGLPVDYALEFTLDRGVTRTSPTNERTRFHGDIQSIVIGGHALDASQFRLHAVAYVGPCGLCVPGVSTGYVFTLAQRGTGLPGPENGNFLFEERAGWDGIHVPILPDAAHPPSGSFGSRGALYVGDKFEAIYDDGPNTVTFAGVSPTPAQGGRTVPEPATWALMLLGFGVTGTALRHRTRPRATA